MEVKSAEIPDKDYIVDEVVQAAGTGVAWRFFGLGDGDTSGTPRSLYIAAGGKEIATALTFVLDKPRVIRGLLLFDPLIEDLPPRLVSRLHAVRCPGIVVVSHTTDAVRFSDIARRPVPSRPIQGPFSRMPNMIFRAVDSVQAVDLGAWQHLVEQMPHRYSMKSQHRKAK